MCTTLVFLTICIAGTSDCDPELTLDPTETAAAEQIKKLGGTISIETNGKTMTVVRVDLRRTQTKDDNLIHLEDLPMVRKLYLDRTQIGNEGLKHLDGIWEGRKSQTRG